MALYWYGGTKWEVAFCKGLLGRTSLVRNAVNY